MKLSISFIFLLSLFTFHFLLFTSTALAAVDSNAGEGSPVCYVCDTTWRLASGDGTCPKDKEVKECKNSDESTFGGCRGGDAAAGEICGAAAEEDKLGIGAGKSLFSIENAQKLIPYGERGNPITDEQSSAEFFDKSSKAYGDNTVDPKCKEQGITNPLDFLVKIFEAIGRLFGHAIPVFQTIYVGNIPAPTACAGDKTSEEFNRGTKDFKDSLLPANFNPLRDTSAHVSFKGIGSDTLKEIVSNAADGQCVPSELLMAISQVEGGQAFDYSNEEVAKFTTTGWQDTASASEKQRGYCYNTCDQAGSGCAPGDNVMGAMQFNWGTWQPLIPDIKKVLEAKFTYTGDVDRCNLRDSFVAAAVKIKRDSGTLQGQCNSWDENTVKNKVARSYCGSCASGDACGVNYCSNVWNLYQSYSNLNK
ncbi:MAG: hypothetical protein AAB599_00820 [Patescibacteria group bacterium]